MIRLAKQPSLHHTVPVVTSALSVEGQARLTLRLLADELVLLDAVGAVSHETVRRT